jgi:hypothetical protein
VVGEEGAAGVGVSEAVKEFQRINTQYSDLCEEYHGKHEQIVAERKRFEQKMVEAFGAVKKEDDETFKELCAEVNRFVQISSRMTKLITMCTVIFKNMSSKTLVVVEKDESKGWYESVTVGVFGFGIRRNEKSRMVESLDDLRYLIKVKDEVVRGLNAHRFLWRWADKFEKFISLVKDAELEELSKERELVIPLTHPFAIGKFPDMLLLKSLVFSKNFRWYAGAVPRITLRYDYLGKANVVGGEVHTGNYSINEATILYMQLREELLERKEEMIGSIRKEIADAETLLLKVRDAFEKELLLAEI